MKLTDKIEITNEDNMALMARYPDNYFSIGITDIPYGINVGKMSFITEKNTSVKQKNGTRLNPNKNKKMKPAVWDESTPSQKWFNEFCRVTKEQIFFGVDYVDYTGLSAGRIKWIKGFSEEMSFKGHETAYCSFIDYEYELKYLWAGMMQGKSIKEPMTQQGNKSLNEERIHPTQKPVLLWDLILLFCIKNGINIKNVLDTNTGLSSLCLSCIKFGFDFTGCDIHKPYFEASVKRIQNHISQLTIFDLGA